jgi:hypothetical protein
MALAVFADNKAVCPTFNATLNRIAEEFGGVGTFAILVKEGLENGAFSETLMVNELMRSVITKTVSVVVSVGIWLS